MEFEHTTYKTRVNSKDSLISQTVGSFLSLPAQPFQPACLCQPLESHDTCPGANNQRKQNCPKATETRLYIPSETEQTPGYLQLGHWVPGDLLHLPGWSGSPHTRLGVSG